METAGVEPAPPRCKRGALPLELHPLVVRRTRCGRMESNHHSARHRVYSAGSSPDAQRPHGTRWPTGFEPAPRSSQPRVLPLHHGHHETGTTGLEPAPSRLTSECSARLSYVPKVRGWDSNPRSRAHEAREDNRSSTAQSGRQESNLRSPAPEAGGVATLPYSQKRMTSTPGGIRTRSFRVESPASSPFRPQGQEAPAAGLEPASRG